MTIHIPAANRPPEDRLRTAYRIVRTPSTGELEGICLSADITGRLTHYHQGRTRPHTEPTCEPCDEGQAPRWQGYIPLLLCRSRDLVLFEFTDTASAPLLDWLANHVSLREVQIRASRLTTKNNGRVLLRLQRCEPDRWALPQPPDVDAILARIWQTDRLVAYETARRNGTNGKNGAHTP